MWNARMDAVAQDDSGVVAIGTVLAGRYRVDSLLGRGGMGRVYRGEHTGMGKPVAIKVLHAALGHNQEAAARFQREAIASGRLDHPNIISVMDFGVIDGGCLYLVMEALEGEHLGQRLDREKRIPWPDALAIMRGVLLGLRHAHDRGVVHRDIKPDNIFLANKDGAGVVKVLDFGIAKLYAGLTDDQMATRDGITVGTPRYLSPEQAVGGAITPACDIYSSSVVLYEMLVGRTPFNADDPLTLLTSHVGNDVPTFHELAPDLELPDGLEPLVRHGLAKFSAERISSAIEYVQRIDEILRANGIDVPATPGAARASQSMGIPVGPYTTPIRGTATLTPSPGFLATPMPFPVAPAPAPKEPVRVTTAKVFASATPRRRRSKWIAIAAAVAVAGGVATYALLPHSSAAPADATTAIISAPPAQPAVDEHAARLDAALRALQSGATCAERRQAISRLVELGDSKVVPALKKARSRGKLNACLRADVDQAIAKLGAK
jgi:serine/threonine-protein kinase